MTTSHPCKGVIFQRRMTIMKNLTDRDWSILLVDDDEDDYVLLSLMLSRVWKDRAVVR
jgi:hypothetical protein